MLDNAPKMTNKIAVIINCFFATPVFLITDKIARTRKKINNMKLKVAKKIDDWVFRFCSAHFC